ncbi:MAG: hypothetical protein JNL82_15875 [Myxococcales bacterium]|nr:hypothetical protein [Myxococcales bacterium]
MIVAWSVAACAAEPGRPPVVAERPAADAPSEPPKPAPALPVAAAVEPPKTTPAEPAAAPVEPPKTAPALPAAATKDRPATGVQPHEDQPAKPGGPVEVKAAALGATAAELDVVFGADGSDVEVTVWGVDGLKISGTSAPKTAMTVRSGQKLRVSVQYAAPAARDGNLAIKVAGVFGGREQSRTQSFTIAASGSPPSSAPPDAGTTDSAGRRVKVMKPR